MWKSLIYKEWIKVRWFALLFAALGVAVLSWVFLQVKHDAAFRAPSDYWFDLLFSGAVYFGALKFVPLAGGLLLAVAQFFPETVNKRIKLSFHLPLSENRLLLTMSGFGSTLLLIIFGGLLAVFTGASSLFFPREIILSAILTLLPWFMAGLAAYYLLALVILEPKWLYRFFYSAVSAAVIALFLADAPPASYSRAIPLLVPIILALNFVLIFPAYRFRKGEM